MKKLLILLTVIGLLTASGCGKKEDTMTVGDESDNIVVEVSEPEPVIQKNPEPEDPEEEPEIIETSPEGMAVSLLTGEYIPKEAVRNRPFAVMINNLSRALPQSGISQAEIMYETLAEGGITRLMAIFQNFDTDRIGPVRSARDYYIDFATDVNAIFVHHGGSPQAYSKLSNTKYNNIDGMKLDGTTFQRDPVRVKQKGMYEHSSYTASERLKSKAIDYKYAGEVSESFSFGFSFKTDEEKRTGGTPAKNVLLRFSVSQKSEFQYDEETKLYKRHQNGKAHIDENTSETLTTKNIIVQIAKISLIPKDKEGRLAISLVTSGKGYYITEGNYYPITWRKDSATSSTKYMDANGEELKLSPGNSWICVFPDNEKIFFDETEVE